MFLYNYTVDLPFSKNQINFRELNTQEQILLAKANLNYNSDLESLYSYHNYVKKVILECLEDKKTFDKINILEYVLLILKIRIISIGNKIEFLLKNKKEKTKVEIDLKSYLLNLYKIGEFFEDDKNSIIFEKNIEVKLGWPSLKSIDLFYELNSKNKKNYELILDSYHEYIQHIKIKNKKIIFNTFDLNEKIKLSDKISLNLKNKIQEKISEALTFLFENKLFEIKMFENQKFNFYNLNFIEHLKMFFSYDIRSLYQEIYILSSFNLPPSYILNISPSERKIYFSIVEEQQKRNQQKDNNNSNINPKTNQNLDDLAIEFGDTPP